MDEAGPPGDAPPPPPLPPPSPLAALPPPGAAAPTLDLGAAFRWAWDVFRAGPGPWIGVVAITYAVIAGLLVVAVALIALASRWGSGTGLVALLVLWFLVFVLVAQLPVLLLLRGAVDAADGRPVSFRSMADPATLARAGLTLGLVLVGVLVGYVLLVVPGIVFGVMAGYALHHTVDDGLEPVAAVRASIATFRARPWPALGVLLVTGLAAGVGVYACGVGIVVSAPVAYLAQVHGFRQITDRTVAPAPSAG